MRARRYAGVQLKGPITVTDTLDDYAAPSRVRPEGHQRGAVKLARIPVKVEPTGEPARKPAWIRARAPTGAGVARIKRILRQRGLHSVCEEALCPNLGECFTHGTATFMIMGDVCTRRCPFCDVAHGRPAALDPEEPRQLAEAVAELDLGYVVVTSVDRDDLRDGGAAHFAACIAAIRAVAPATTIEVLVPDFRGREEIAVALLAEAAPTSSTTTSKPCRGCIASVGRGPTMPGRCVCCATSSRPARASRRSRGSCSGWVNCPARSRR